MQRGCHILDIPSIQKKLNRPLALFLDFDGTLVPISPRPEQALLAPATRKLLRSLSRQLPVAIVSGRSLRDIKARVGLNGLTYAGNHGLEIVGRGFRFHLGNGVDWLRLLKKLTQQLQQDFKTLRGILIEDKGITLSVHYRLANKKTRQKAGRLLMRQVKPLKDHGRLRIGLGKAVWEIRPPQNWDKGRAVLWVLKQTQFHKRWPLYIGDDKTDQDAFRSIRNKGLGIAVGPPRLKGVAHYTVEDPREVNLFLERLLAYLPS